MLCILLYKEDKNHDVNHEADFIEEGGEKRVAVFT